VRCSKCPNWRQHNDSQPTVILWDQALYGERAICSSNQVCRVQATRQVSPSDPLHSSSTRSSELAPDVCVFRHRRTHFRLTLAKSKRIRLLVEVQNSADAWRSNRQILVAVGTTISDRPPAEIRTSASAHTALTKDEWRKSVRQDRGGPYAKSAIGCGTENSYMAPKCMLCRNWE